jgi:hypothetical protein
LQAISSSDWYWNIRWLRRWVASQSDGTTVTRYVDRPPSSTATCSRWLQMPVQDARFPFSTWKLAGWPTTASKSMFGLSERATTVHSKRALMR